MVKLDDGSIDDLKARRGFYTGKHKGLFYSATSRAKVVVFRPSSGSGRRILFHRHLDICTSKVL